MASSSVSPHARLQRGRAPESAECENLALRSVRTGHASTGPRSGERGVDQVTKRMDSDRSASTGPRSGERGVEIRNTKALLRRTASTGPRSGERGV